MDTITTWFHLPPSRLTVSWNTMPASDSQHRLILLLFSVILWCRRKITILSTTCVSMHLYIGVCEWAWACAKLYLCIPAAFKPNLSLLSFHFQRQIGMGSVFLEKCEDKGAKKEKKKKSSNWTWHLLQVWTAESEVTLGFLLNCILGKHLFCLQVVGFNYDFESDSSVLQAREILLCFHQTVSEIYSELWKGNIMENTVKESWLWQGTVQNRNNWSSDISPTTVTPSVLLIFAVLPVLYQVLHASPVEYHFAHRKKKRQKSKYLYFHVAWPAIRHVHHQYKEWTQVTLTTSAKQYGNDLWPHLFSAEAETDICYLTTY